MPSAAKKPASAAAGKKAPPSSAKKPSSASAGYTPTSDKDKDGRKVYTKAGKHYVRRKKPDGTYGMRQAALDVAGGGVFDSLPRVFQFGSRAPAEAVNLSRSIRSLKDVARQIERRILHVSPEKLDSARQNIDKITTTLREGDNDRSQKPPTQGENDLPREGENDRSQKPPTQGENDLPGKNVRSNLRLKDVRLPGKIYDSVQQHRTEFTWLLSDGEFNRYARNLTPLKTSAERRDFLSAFITQLANSKKHKLRYEAARLLLHMESVELKQAISEVMTYDPSFKQSFQGFHAKWVDDPETAEDYMWLLSVLEDVETSLRSRRLHGLIDMANRIRTSIGVILEEGSFWTGNNNEW